jgi:hypothetical protein
MIEAIMNTGTYWVVITALDFSFSIALVNAARKLGDRGLALGAIAGLVLFNVLGYLDWRRDMPAPLAGYLLLASDPTVGQLGSCLSYCDELEQECPCRS